MNVVVFCSNCLDEPYLFSRMFWISFNYNGAAWMAYWKGSEFLVEFWDKHIPWVKSPIKRFSASLLSIAAYVFLAVWVLDLFFDLLIFDMTLSDALKESGAPFLNVLLITLVINVFMHGRGFLLSWRQAAIDVERLHTEQVATQYNSLKNQVNPHFLFNSLNALSSLVYDDQDKAVEFIRKLSQVYRYVLDKKDDELVTIGEEVAFLESFIFLQKIRFGENLRFEITGEDTKGYLPPLALQLLVENAIKHNVVSEKDPLLITVSITDDYCVISNSIKEKLDKDSTGIGLKNLKDRYGYMSDKEMIIETDDEEFVVRIPVLKLKE